MRIYRLALLAGILSAFPAPAVPPAAKKLLDNVQAIGDATAEKGVISITGAKATLVIGSADADSYRMTAEIKFADKATSDTLQVMPSDLADVNKPAALYGWFYRDPAGLSLTANTYFWDTKTGKWDSKNDAAYYTYWPAPTNKGALAQLDGSGIPSRSLKDRWLPLRINADRRRISFWLDGLCVRQLDRPAGSKGPVTLQLSQGDQVRSVVLAPLADSLYVPVDLTPFAHDRLAAPLGKTSLAVAGVPFDLAAGGQGLVDLRRAKWIEQKTDPADYYENYEAGPPIVHDPRMPLLRVPVEDYTAAHVLAVADDDPATTPNFTLRAGRYGFSEQVVFHSFPGTAPRKAEAAKVPVGDRLDTPAGPLFHVRVPMTEAFAQDIERWIEIELTKEIRLARRQPDPCRFRSRPLGLPSGLKIAGLTLERSPLQMRVTSKETGHAFTEPQKPTFQVRLVNITAVEQPYELLLMLTHFDRTNVLVEQKGRVAAGMTAEIELTAPTAKRGYHDVAVVLSSAGRLLLGRSTSCCLLPPDTRKHRETSPFGTWDFCGGHYTSNDPDQTGPLYVKLGLRWGMFGYKPEQRKKWGILAGNEPNIYDGGLKAWEEYLKVNPDSPQIALIYHETAVSGQQVTRLPDFFHDGPALKFTAEEEKTFKTLLDKALTSARAIKAKYPKCHLRLGNGTLPMKEGLYRAKFPSELFDSAGNESASFGRPPEAQPPDCVALNSSLWMDRQLLDAYGYRDKPVTMCLETGYPATSPGNLTMQEQADYLVRLGLHALAWEIPQIKLGQISDMGNGYYFSNWGAIGFVHPKPELNVKPSFVAFATMTRVLDGAKFVRDVPTGSPSLYCLEFHRPDGTQAHVLWTIRGKRSVRLVFDSPGPWTQIDDQGAETAVPSAQGVVEVALTPSPVYLVGKGRIEGIAPRLSGKGAPQYVEKPAGKSAVLSPLADLTEWTIEEARDPEIEYYDFFCPRHKGDFGFSSTASFEGKERVLEVKPRTARQGKETMPMYAVLAHKKGIPVPGTQTEVGAWVNGNSSWGRLIFEVQDASGQRWISLGAQQQDVPRKWIDDLVPPDMLAKWSKPGINDWNTGDVFSISRINFDGWRWLAFPLPGNYPGENHPWPANSQWRWDKDGVVHYPLTFKRLVIELPEKVLHVKTFAPPPRAEIYLKDLSVGQDDRQLGYVRGADR
jgi:hypothetical protein